MNQTNLKENITKIEQLLRSDNYEAGFELLLTLNNTELIKALDKEVISCLVMYLNHRDIKDVMELSMKLGLFNLFQMHLAKVSSIDSNTIKLLNERDDLDETVRRIIELKYSLSKLYKKHLQDNQGFDIVSEISDEQWINDSEISKKNLGEIIFETLYRDDNKKLVLAVTKNPHFPSAYLKELYELHQDKFDWDSYRLYLTWIILSHSNCPETVLEMASDKNEGYCSSLIRKAVALNKNTNQHIIAILLKDQYRWVRQAAASHSSLKKNDILKLIESGDRYILKGLKENMNCDTNVIKKITTLLEDEKKYPLEYTTYSVSGSEEPGRACAGVVPIDTIVALIKSGDDFPDGLYEIGDAWIYFDDIYHSDGSFDGPGGEVIVNDPKINTEEEYIVGDYEIELLTIPRYKQEVYIGQDSTSIIKVKTPGIANIQLPSKGFGGVYFLRRDNWEQVWHFRNDKRQYKLTLLPGRYKVVFRAAHAKEYIYTNEKEWDMLEGKSKFIKIY